ncbi:MAG: hypothetical protein O9315_17445 [Beijerinckiaceae bacterium]|nr:hypothetical protein [Beijerinckiaceae bacterium]
MRGALGFVLTAGVFVLPVASVDAQTHPRNAGLPKLANVQPVPGFGGGGRNFGFINNLVVSTGLIYGDTRRKRSATTHTDKSYTPTLGVSFGMGTMGFAAINTSYTRHESRSNIAAFNLPVDSRTESYGVDAMVGIAPLPFLRFGVLGGIGRGDSSYGFTNIAAARIGSDGRTHRIGAFASGSYAMGRFLFTLDTTVLAARNFASYDPGNNPPSARWGANLGMIGGTVNYAVTDRFNVWAGTVFNLVMSQKVAGNEPKLDPSWVTLQIGARYRVTANWELNARIQTWVANSRYNYTSGGLGLSYRF